MRTKQEGRISLPGIPVIPRKGDNGGEKRGGEERALKKADGESGVSGMGGGGGEGGDEGEVEGDWEGGVEDVVVGDWMGDTCAVAPP